MKGTIQKAKLLLQVLGIQGEAGSGHWSLGEGAAAAKNVRLSVCYCAWEHVSECVRVWMCVFPHVGRAGEGESCD